MYPELLVEIALTRSGAIPEDLIVRAYAASRFEPIALILNGIAAQLVNTVLDPIVPTMPLDIPGVLYVNMSSDGCMWDMLRAARLVFTSTLGFRSTAIASGVKKSRIRSAESAFLIPSEVKPSWHGSVQAARLMNVEQIPPAGTYEIVQRRLSLLRHEMQLAKSNPRIGR